MRCVMPSCSNKRRYDDDDEDDDDLCLRACACVGVSLIYFSCHTADCFFWNISFTLHELSLVPELVPNAAVARAC